jgi:hypothetical protein
MKLLATLEISIQIIQKHGLFYTQIFDCDSMNLIFEEESLTRQGADNTAATFIIKMLGSQS